MSGKRLTRQQAINANCRQCSGDDADVGTWRQQVTACTVTTCTLRPYRPLAENLPQRLIDLWRIDIELLDDRARALIVPDKASNLHVRPDSEVKHVEAIPINQ